MFNKNLLKQKKTVILILALLITVVMIIVISAITTAIKVKGSSPIIQLTATLEKIVDEDKLSTYSTLYNGIAIAYNDKNPEKIDYYVTYKSYVKAGIDFKNIQIIEDEDLCVITITLPEINITDITVSAESLEFIFINDKRNTIEETDIALQLCYADAEEEILNNTDLIKLARENAETIIQALTQPLIDNIFTEYTLVIE